MLVEIISTTVLLSKFLLKTRIITHVFWKAKEAGGADTGDSAEQVGYLKCLFNIRALGI